MPRVVSVEMNNSEILTSIKSILPEAEEGIL